VITGGDDAGQISCAGVIQFTNAYEELVKRFQSHPAERRDRPFA
jgi:hypothetical protein